MRLSRRWESKPPRRRGTRVRSLPPITLSFRRTLVFFSTPSICADYYSELTKTDSVNIDSKPWCINYNGRIDGSLYKLEREVREARRGKEKKPKKESALYVRTYDPRNSPSEKRASQCDISTCNQTTGPTYP